MESLKVTKIGRGGNGIIAQIKFKEGNRKNEIVDIDAVSLKMIENNCVYKIIGGDSGFYESKLNKLQLSRGSPLLISYPLSNDTIIHRLLTRTYQQEFPGKLLTILSMEHRHMTLKQYLDQLYVGQRFVPQEQMERILYSVVLGIALLHDKGVSHMDLSLQNIMLNAVRKSDATECYADINDICIIDFGQIYPIDEEGEYLTNCYVSTITCMAPEQHILPAFISPVHQDIWAIGILALCLFDRSNSREEWCLSLPDMYHILLLNRSLHGIDKLVDKVQSYIPHNFENENVLLTTAKSCLLIDPYDRCMARDLAVYLYTNKGLKLDMDIYSLIEEGYKSFVKLKKEMKVYEFVKKYIFTNIRLSESIQEIEILTRGKFSNKAYLHNMLCTITPSIAKKYVKKTKGLKEKDNLCEQHRSICRAKHFFNKTVSGYISNFPNFSKTTVKSAFDTNQKFNCLLYSSVMEHIVRYLYGKIRKNTYHQSGLLTFENPKYCMIAAAPSGISGDRCQKEYIDIDCLSNFILDKDDIETNFKERNDDILYPILKFLSCPQNYKNRIFEDNREIEMSPPPMSCKFFSPVHLKVVDTPCKTKKTGNSSLFNFEDGYNSLNKTCSKIQLYEINCIEEYTPEDCITNILSSVVIDRDLLTEALKRSVVEKSNGNPQVSEEELFNQEWIHYEISDHFDDMAKKEMQEAALSMECKHISTALLEFMHNLENVEVHSNVYMNIEEKNVLPIYNGKILMNPISKHALKNILYAGGLSQLWSCDASKIKGHSISVIGTWLHKNNHIKRSTSLFYENNSHFVCDIENNFPFPKFILDISLHYDRNIISQLLDTISDTYCTDLINYMVKDLNCNPTTSLII